MATRRIKFIGKTPYKTDNVCRTNLYWSHPGAVVEAPEDISVRLLAHPDVWVEAKADDDGLPIKEDPVLTLSDSLTREERIEIAVGIIDQYDCLFEVMARFDPDVSNTVSETIIGDDVDPVDHSGDEQESITGLEDAGPATAPPLIAFSPNRDEAIVQAINALNRDNEEHFTKDEIPRVEAIEGLLGYDVTAAERTAAWDVVLEGEGK